MPKENEKSNDPTGDTPPDAHLRHLVDQVIADRVKNTSMRRTRSFILTVLLSILPALPGVAQAKGALERKIVDKVSPVYPALAKRMNLRGMVKLEVVVRPNGTVKSAKVMGGNPVLVDSAADAVQKWKFEPTANETTGIVEVSFEPR
jgi:TonB family protein